MATNQRCGNCRFWRYYLPGNVPIVGPIPGWVVGECRRNPPTASSTSPVDADYWCGEYQPAKPQTVSEAAATLARLVLLGDLTAAHALVDKLQEERSENPPA